MSSDTVSFSKILGSSLIIAGTCIGAGMLVLPLITAAVGFPIACLLLCVICVLMMASALLIAEVNLNYPSGVHFSNMARRSLGRWAQIITWICFLGLLYSLAAAYTSQASTLLGLWLGDLGIHFPSWLNGLFYILVLGAFVYTGTAAVDGLNRFLMSFKGIAFIGLAIVLSPHVTHENLTRGAANYGFLWVTFPLLITSFGYQHIIPNIRAYLNSDKRAIKQAIIVGSLIPLVIYLLWEIMTLGTIPLYGQNSFQYISSHGGSATELVETYHNLFHSDWVATFSTAFTNVAVLTSFLGVTLGLFSFNQDSYRLTREQAKHKVPAFFITFLPPFLFAVFYPDGFVMALGYASIFVATMLIVLPALMVWKIRNQKSANSFKGRAYLLFIALVGLFIIGLQVATDFHYLPVFH